MDFAVVIPAQEHNRYHKLGDLAPFGDTTLLEWKIAQCKEFAKSSQIYINSDSEVIDVIAQREKVNFIKRSSKISYNQIIIDTTNKVNEDVVVWTNPTSPFLRYKDYLAMIEKYRNNQDINSIVSIYSKYDYVYFNNKRLNFTNTFISRKKITPIQVVTNGCYVIKKDLVLKNKSLYCDKSFLHELDYLSSIEIKDIHTYQISTELISAYFRRDLDV